MTQKNIPRHIAIIMDGNGRWARARGLPRVEGHRRGVESIRNLVTALSKQEDVEYLTLYAFSRENWKRPAKEVGFLMRLLRYFCRRERKMMMKNSVRFTTIGALSSLPKTVREEVRKTRQATRDNAGLTMCLAINYGGRDEIVRAARRIARRTASGEIQARSISERLFARHLQTAGMPDPDLLIRTAGEMRLSNFLLWEASYAELWFTNVLWPDFRMEHLNKAIRAYSSRTRKYGAVEDAR